MDTTQATDPRRDAESGPLVSIGVPVFNRAESLPRCLDALLAQTYRHLEICMSDNASTDGSTEICRRYVERDPRMQLKANPQNLGVIANFNIVRRMGRGRYFMWAASDDHWAPEFVAELVAELEARTEACAAMCGTRRVYADGEALEPIRYLGRLNPNQMSVLGQARNLLTTSTAVRKQKLALFTCGLYRKRVLDQVLEDCPSDDFGGDRPLNAVIALSGGLRYVDKILFTKTLHRRSFSERNPDDIFVRAKSERGYLNKTLMVVRWILRARTVPWYRKLYIPLIIGPRILLMARNALVEATPTPLRRLARGAQRPGRSGL